MPEAVVGLCDIALIRNRANHYGIKEIKQNENTILLYFDNLNNPDIYDLIGKAKGKAILTPSQNPYITLSFGKKDKALNALIELFREE